MLVGDVVRSALSQGGGVEALLLSMREVSLDDSAFEDVARSRHRDTKML